MYTQVVKRFEPRQQVRVPREDAPAAEPEEPQALQTELHADTPATGTVGKRKRLKMALVDVKCIAERPEIVQWFDADAPDPPLLVALKAVPGVVQVPAHWQNRSEYLNSRLPRVHNYELPQNIKDTGIMEMRDVFAEDASLRQKTRERVQPKLGKMDVDYRKFHAAIYHFQRKPPLSGYGEIYTETRDDLVNAKEFLPGRLSHRLRAALGISADQPPPWAHAMAKIPPPAYPGLRIGAPLPHYTPEYWGDMILDDASEDESEAESANSSVEAQDAEMEIPAYESDESVVEYEQAAEQVASGAGDSDDESEDRRVEPARHLYTEPEEVASKGFMGTTRKYKL